MTEDHLLATLADVERFEAVPFDQRYSAHSGFELLLQAGEEFGDDPALQEQISLVNRVGMAAA